ncbi:DegT/DnrJ/EryC1/StrS family aminotransferase [Streptomyces rishiriensis]|uniref:DegT/DnrJ/EryC1/StrS family aminotransferase n=1 Tax=Streptomyces rishiriensis TaxID=68264 RepID=UPI0027D808A1|nr:DegT/DnrJ/EryC1/StrS family aminotransferase [Streptomyces rishiriensis]
MTAASTCGTGCTSPTTAPASNSCCLKARGIGVGVHYRPNHLQPAFGRWRRDLPATEHVAGEILTMPFHQHLAETDIDHVVTTLGEVLTSVGTA